jgi:ketosteroid isomerase-like protein
MAQDTVRIASEAPTWVVELYKAVDSHHLEGILALCAEDFRYRSGNAEPIVGHDALRARSGAHFESIRGMSHQIRQVWESGDSAAVVADVDYTCRSGAQVRLPAITLIHRRVDGLIDEMQIIMDISPVRDERP